MLRKHSSNKAKRKDLYLHVTEDNSLGNEQAGRCEEVRLLLKYTAAVEDEKFIGSDVWLRSCSKQW